MAPQTAISKAVCYKTKNEQLWEKAVHFLFVATNCFLHHYQKIHPTLFFGCKKGCKSRNYLIYTLCCGE